MLISELAEKVGLHPETIRRLEKRGVIPAARRDANGWRHYSEGVIKVLKERYAGDERQPPEAA